MPHGTHASPPSHSLRVEMSGTHAQVLPDVQRVRVLAEMATSHPDGFRLLRPVYDAAGAIHEFELVFENAAAKSMAVDEARDEGADGRFVRYVRVAETGASETHEACHGHEDAARWYRTVAVRSGADVAVWFTDVTERKRAELAQARANEAERRARTDAEAANRSKDEFLALVSHELRTPLTAMLGWTKLLRAGALTPARQAQALETVERNAKVQTQIIDDLLDVSRIVSGKLRMELRPLDLATVVNDAVDAVRPSAEAKKLALVVEIGEVPGVAGDADRLAQIVTNLLTNAVKFTPAGGAVRVELERAGKARDLEVVLAVTDTGQGIDAETLPFVFERFRQGVGPGGRTGTGLGLGLSIVKHIALLHGATVSASSEGRGHGARFELRIPAMAGAHTESVTVTDTDTDTGADNGAVTAERCTPAQPVVPHRTTTVSGTIATKVLARRRVLVIDDDLDTRTLIASVLEHAGASVTSVDCVHDAIARLCADRYDVLVSDIGLPGEDGYSLVRRVRALPVERNGAIPALAVTAFARTEDRIRALATGFDSHLAKPLDPSELVAVTASLLERSSAAAGR